MMEAMTSHLSYQMLNHYDLYLSIVMGLNFVQLPVGEHTLARMDNHSCTAAVNDYCCLRFH